MLDVASGQADVLFNGMLATLPYVRSGKLKLLAVTSVERNPALPETPTFAEAGVPDFVTGSWQGILAPGKTPPEIVAKLQAETRRILLTADVKEKLSGRCLLRAFSRPSSPRALPPCPIWRSRCA